MPNNILKELAGAECSQFMVLLPSGVCFSNGGYAEKKSWGY